MSHQANALDFVTAFCEGRLDDLSQWLADDLHFHGPMLECSGREAYLEALRKSPPEPAPYRIVTVTKNPHQVCVVYEYENPKGTLTIAQVFAFENNRIVDIRVIFDTWPLRQ